MFTRLRRAFELLLESATILLMVTLTVIVVLAVVFRKAGASLSWYDEVAEVLLAWLTYYAAALAALKREHIGFPGLVNAVKPSLRVPLVVISEVFVLGFFTLLAWVGYSVLLVLTGDTLVSLPWVTLQVTQSVIPIGAVLFVIAELLSLPEVVARTRAKWEAGEGQGPEGAGQIPAVVTKGVEP